MGHNVSTHQSIKFVPIRRNKFESHSTYKPEISAFHIDDLVGCKDLIGLQTLVG